MPNQPLPAPLNASQRLARLIIVHARTSLLIPIFRRFSGTEKAQVQLEYLQSLPVGTLGRGVAECLQRHHLQLIPQYEDHDLKHVVLGYDMTPEDELKLKAFMLGNGDWSLTCIGFLALAILTPELWPELRRHFRRGQQAHPIKHWRLGEYATESVELLRRRIDLRAAADC